jgi:uncharacterized protein Usg
VGASAFDKPVATFCRAPPNIFFGRVFYDEPEGHFVGKRSKEVLMVSKATVPQGVVCQGAVSEDFKKQLAGYGLTTAEILYRRPDHRWLLQSYVWQNYDLFPNFPALKDFLAFWQTKLEGPLVAVTVAHSKLVKPAELKAVDGVFRLH